MRLSDPLPAAGRGPLLRDLLVFQFKLVLGNFLNVVLLPATLAFGAWGLLRRRGDGFYRVLEAGRDLEERIDIYGAVGGYHAAADGSRRRTRVAGVDLGDATVDDLIARVETLIAREAGGGGATARLKSALERLREELRRRR